MKDLSSMLNNAVRDGSACIRPPVFTEKEAPWIHNLVKPPTTAPNVTVTPYETQTRRDGQPSSSSRDRRPARGSVTPSTSSGSTPSEVVILRSRSRPRSRSPLLRQSATTGNRPRAMYPERRPRTGSPRQNINITRRPRTGSPAPSRPRNVITPTRGQPIYLAATEGYWEAEWDRCFPGLRRGKCYYCFGNHRPMNCPNLATYTCSWCQSNIHWKPNCKKYKRVRNYRADNPR